MSDPIKEVGKRVRSIRIQRSITQQELGTRAGTNQAVIQKIENGKSRQPRCIVEIATVLNVNPAWLQFGEPFASEEMPNRSME